MKILIFGVDYKINDFECKFVFNEDEFYEEIINRHYDVLIVNFDYFSEFSEVKRFFKGIVIFAYGYVDELIYKKSLEAGDYFYIFDELWKLDYRLKYISKKLLDQKRIFIFNDLVFDLKEKVLYKNKKSIKLSPAERDVLTLLINNKSSFISKDFILQNSENIDTISSIKVLISKLRKLGFDIENQRELGYKLNKGVKK